MTIKRVIVVLVVTILLLVVGAAAVFFIMGRSGSSAIERWIGSQLKAIANEHLNPRLEFSDLDYEYPLTVKLKQLRLTADDPGAPGKTVDILGAADAKVTLAKLPSVGSPIVIEKIILNQPLFQAIAVGPGKKPLVGFSNFVKAGVVQGATRPQSPTRKKLSDVFQMRLLELVDGKIVYDPRLADTEPMVLDQINTRMDVAPGGDGAYAVALELHRKPVFNLNIAGRLNLDTMHASDIDISLLANLKEDKHSFLPPQVQRWLKEHQARGELSVKVDGEMPLTAYRKGNVSAAVRISETHIQLGEYRLPVQKLEMNAKLAGGRVLLPRLQISAMKGELTAGGQLMLNDALDTRFAIQAADMQIDELFVKPGTDEDPKLAGRLNAGVNVATSLKALQTRQGLLEKWGDGQLNLDRARLVRLPVIGELTEIIGGVTRTKKLIVRPTEKADATFIFTQDKVHFHRFDYIGNFVAARGRGTISLDKQLDLLVNAGPVEKVQSLMGKNVGGLFGKLTDQLVSYRVRGHTGKPEIRLHVGGAAGTLVGEGAKGVGNAVGGVIRK